MSETTRLREALLDELFSPRNVMVAWSAVSVRQHLDALIEAAAAEARAGLVKLPDWVTLANIIRTVDGNHDLGAEELAASIHAALAATTPAPERCADDQHDWEQRYPGDLHVCRRCWFVETDAIGPTPAPAAVGRWCKWSGHDTDFEECAEEAGSSIHRSPAGHPFTPTPAPDPSDAR